MRIKELRQQTNLNQTETAKKMGLPRVNYNKYENEEIEPNIETLKKFADYFNVSLDYLCGRTWNNQIGYIPEDKKEVVKIILQLNDINTIKALSYCSGLLAGQN